MWMAGSWDGDVGAGVSEDENVDGVQWGRTAVDRGGLGRLRCRQLAALRLAAELPGNAYKEATNPLTSRKPHRASLHETPHCPPCG